MAFLDLNYKLPLQIQTIEGALQNKIAPLTPPGPQSFAGITKFVLISSGPSPAIAGGDAVDYGAYRAFGWGRRRRRSPQVQVAPQNEAAGSAYANHPKGRVGPVYTFVPTNPEANFKWGVRHVAGVQYGKQHGRMQQEKVHEIVP